MIKRVKIKNFLSHEDTDVQLVPGLNIITGETDSGKSALFNAIRWGVTNQPLGTKYQSWDSTDPTQVTLEFNDGVVTHERTKTKNSFICNNDVTLSALRSDVPTEVSTITKMGDINFQDQHSLYFMLQQTAGQVSSSFNEVTGLSIIDEVRSEVSTQITKLDGKMNDIVNDITKLENDLAIYADLDIVETLVDEIETLQQQVQTLTENKIRITQLLSFIDGAEIEISQLDELLNSESLINECSIIHQEYLDKVNAQTQLNLLIHDLEYQEGIVNQSEYKLGALVTLDHLMDLRGQLVTLNSDRANLVDLIQKLGAASDLVSGAEQIEITYRETIANLIEVNGVCPLCQNEINPQDIPHILENL